MTVRHRQPSRIAVVARTLGGGRLRLVSASLALGLLAGCGGVPIVSAPVNVGARPLLVEGFAACSDDQPDRV